MSNRVTVLLALFACVMSGRALYASYTAPPTAWTSAYELEPANTDAVSLADDHIRGVKNEVRRRLETELDFGTFGNVQTDLGRHVEGAARCFFQTTAPPVDGTLTALCLTEGDVNGDRGCDEGRCWVDTDGPDNVASNSDDYTLYFCQDTDADGDCDAWRAGVASIASSAGIVPTNAIVLWDQSDTCPAGFTEATEFRNLLVRGADRGAGNANIPDSAGVDCTGSSTGVGCGAPTGTANYNDTLDTAEMPVHNHSIGVNSDSSQNATAPQGMPANETAPTNTFNTNNTGSGEVHLHPFRTVLFCRKS